MPFSECYSLISNHAVLQLVQRFDKNSMPSYSVFMLIAFIVIKQNLPGCILYYINQINEPYFCDPITLVRKQSTRKVFVMQLE